jgi:hypothetical protein
MYDYYVLCLSIDLTKVMPNDTTLLLRHLLIHCPQGRQVDYHPMHSVNLLTAWRVKTANQGLQCPLEGRQKDARQEHKSKKPPNMQTVAIHSD